MGRRPKLTAKAFEQGAEEYFEVCEENKEIPSKVGLVVSLDITRTTLSRYFKKKEYRDAIKRAHSKIEHAWIQRLNKPACTGAIFYLKNAFKKNYSDKKEHEHSGSITVETTNYGTNNKNKHAKGEAPS